MPPTNDDPRQGYTGYQKDDESGLDYAQARYYNSAHGRFTSVDPLTASASIKNPQTFNRYSYVLNSPYKFTDPLGLLPMSSYSGSGFCSASRDSCEDGDGDELTTRSEDQYRQQQQEQEKKKQQEKQKAKTKSKKATAKKPKAPPKVNQTPTSLKVVSVSELAPAEIPPGYVQGSNTAVYAGVTYQVLNQNGKPIKDANMIPVERITYGEADTSTDAGNFSFTPSNNDDITPVGGKIAGQSVTTTSSGQFTDSPVGSAMPPVGGRRQMPDGSTVTVESSSVTIKQEIFIRVGAKDYLVRVNNFVVTNNAQGKTITNNKDICSGSGCK